MKNKINLLSTLIIFVLSSLLISGCTNKESTTNTNMNLNTIPTPSEETVLGSKTEVNINPVVSLKTKDGEILIKLYQDKAPNTVANFIKKADEGFYNGLLFHRVIPGFMAQGGDPTGTGSGGGKQNSELNDVPFVRGSIGLARTAETKLVSNDSQFYICFTTEGCQHLTSDYVNFGEVISGLEVLDMIKQGDKILEITTKTK
ncbi:MAG: peptidylprolyl isomerase [Candidatus Shapirobacteria bacterium]|nr:peptidylprolyl isomerase [Candidatus Shapirobacteria bacterium]